jgi:NADH dehydrogenase [ubiquinone] 1 alpha subcomplex assembly factor 3
MAMRAPSIDLLRALRSAALPRQVHPGCRAAATRSIFAPSTSHPRTLSSSSHHPAAPRTPAGLPRSHDRGPASTEDTQTDFGALDVLRNTKIPATNVDACTTMGFHLNNGTKTADGSGILLLGGEAFRWRPWGPEKTVGSLLSRTGVLNVEKDMFGLLDVLHPKPDLLIIGTGDKLWMLSPQTRAYLESIGIRVEMQDTANAASTYNLLATERGVEGVGAAMLPIGFKGLMKR